MPVLLAIALVLGCLGGMISQNKGGSFGFGFLLGGLLGVIGLIIVAASKPSAPRLPVELQTRECPSCKSQMRRDAEVCPHCQRESEPWILHENRWWVKRPSGDYWLDDKTGQWVKHEVALTGDSEATEAADN